MKVIEFDKPTAVGLNGSGGYVYDCTRKCLLVSEPHWKLPDGRWSGGGPFYVIKETLYHTRHLYRATKLSTGGTWSLKGVSPGPSRLPSYAAWLPMQRVWAGDKREEVDSHFATGWARARPGNPVASLGQFIVELRDLPAVPFKRALKGGAAFKNIPRIALKELSDFRNLGSEYLNVVFGWKPFVSDLRKMYHLWYTIDKKMAQIVRENGKHIRRKATIQNERTSSQPAPTYWSQPFMDVYGQPPWWTNGSTQRTDTTTAVTKVWFSGSFRYYIPDTSSSAWDLRARAALFGALPTPELLWEVLPWSWLVDWFTNVGDVVSNASMNAVDNLTSSYAYVMKHEKISIERQAVVESQALSPCSPWICKDGAFGSTIKTFHVKETKSRSGTGNPFGLGITLGSLSGYQLGILAALGISRSKVRG